jgi:hypothetical protein
MYESNGKIEFEYDPEWIAILKKTRDLMSFDKYTSSRTLSIWPTQRY